MMLLETSVLPTPAAARHPGRLREQIRDRRGQVMIRIQQAGAAGDDAVAVVVGVAGERHVEPVLQRDQSGHGVGRRTIHADLAVPVERHEAEGGVDIGVLHGNLQPVPLGDAAPVGDAGAAQRIGADRKSRAANGVEIDDRAEVVDVVRDEIEPRRRGPAFSARS